MIHMQEVTNATVGIRDYRAPASPSKNNYKKMPALFKGNVLVVAGHIEDCLEMCSCFFYIYIPYHTSVLDGFLGKDIAATLDEHRLIL